MRLCKKLGVLLVDRSGRKCVATGPLYRALGPDLYHQCRECFVYVGQFPDAGMVEKYLKANWARIEKNLHLAR